MRLGWYEGPYLTVGNTTYALFYSRDVVKKWFRRQSCTTREPDQTIRQTIIIVGRMVLNCTKYTYHFRRHTEGA